MSTGLLEQLADYGAYHDEVQGSVDATDIVTGVRSGSVSEVPSPRSTRSMRGGAVAAAAAVAVLLVLGGVTWLLRSSSEPVTDQTPPTSEVTTTTEVEADPLQNAPAVDEPLVATDVIELEGTIPLRFWSTNRIIGADGAVWVGTWNGTDYPSPGDPSAIYRIDASSSEVTDQILLPAGVIDLLVEGPSIWALLGNDSVVRIDLDTRQVADTVESIFGIDALLPRRSDLIIANDGLWVAHNENEDENEVARIDLDTHAIDVYGTPAGVVKWLGEADGALWGLHSHNVELVSIDLTTYEARRWDAGLLDGESDALMDGETIWIGAVCCPGFSRGFDIPSRSFGRTYPGAVVAVVNGGLWTGPPDAASLGVLVRHDLTGEEPVEIDLNVAFRLTTTTSDGSIWFVTSPRFTEDVSTAEVDPELVRIDSLTRTETQRIATAKEATDLLVYADAIWIASEDGTLVRISNP